MADAPRGYNSAEEYFQDLERKVRSRKGIFHGSTGSYGKSRQGRGTTDGPYGSSMFNVVGDSSSYDEAYGPPNKVRRSMFAGTGGSYDEGFIARRNSREDAYIKEREEKEKQAPPKKKRKKKSK